MPNTWAYRASCCFNGISCNNDSLSLVHTKPVIKNFLFRIFLCSTSHSLFGCLAGWLYACVQVRKTSTTFIFLYCLFSFVSFTYFVVTCAVCIVWMSHRERELETRWKKCLAHVSVLRWIKEKLQIQTIKLQGYADVIVVVLLATALERHRMQVAKTCTSHQWHTNLPLNVNFVLELTRKTKEPTIYPWHRFLIYPYKKNPPSADKIRELILWNIFVWLFCHMRTYPKREVFA